MANNEDRPLTIEELGDGSVTVVDPLDPQAPNTQGGGDLADHADDSELDAPSTPGGTEHPEDAAALAGATSDAEREAIRERRRQERRDKKEAAKQREQWFKDQLSQRDRLISEMSERLRGVEDRTIQADLVQLDTAIQRANGAHQYYKDMVAEATKKQDGNAVAEATEGMLRARGEAERLKMVKQQVSVAGAPKAATAPPDPVVVSNAQAWANRNSWYVHNGADMDSRIALAIDQDLARTHDPRLPSYWEEFDKRVAQYLPHRAQKSYTPGSPSGEPSTTGRSPVAGGGRSAAGAGGSSAAGKSGNSYTLSAERVKALKDAGIWDDPVARADAIRRYRDYDRQQTSARS